MNCLSKIYGVSGAVYFECHNKTLQMINFNSNLSSLEAAKAKGGVGKSGFLLKYSFWIAQGYLLTVSFT